MTSEVHQTSASGAQLGNLVGKAPELQADCCALTLSVGSRSTAMAGVWVQNMCGFKILNVFDSDRQFIQARGGVIFFF